MLQTYREFATALITRCNSGLISPDSHTFDNSFLEPNARDMHKKMQETGLEAVGISFNCPYNKYHDDDVAFIFRDELDEIRWIHLTRICWEGFVIDCYGEKEDDRMIGKAASSQISRN